MNGMRNITSIISVILLRVDVIISDSERLDMLQWGANKDTMESTMMDGSHGDDSANQCFS